MPYFREVEDEHRKEDERRRWLQEGKERYKLKAAAELKRYHESPQYLEDMKNQLEEIEQRRSKLEADVDLLRRKKQQRLDELAQLG